MANQIKTAYSNLERKRVKYNVYKVPKTSELSVVSVYKSIRFVGQIDSVQNEIVKDKLVAKNNTEVPKLIHSIHNHT